MKKTIKIPVSVLKNTTLSATQKILYGVICSLKRPVGPLGEGCYSTNAELRKKMAGCSVDTITKCLRALKHEGFISIRFSRGTMTRRIAIIEKQKL